MTNIVMIVRDRLKLTTQSLESLYAHTDPSQFNLTLVDDGSEDFRVLHLLRKYGYKPNATLVRLENSRHVLGEIKNIGAAVSGQTFGWGDLGTDWLYLSDNDVYFTPDWLTKLTEFATGEEPECTLFGGQIHPFHDKSDIEVLAGPSWLLRWYTWASQEGFRRGGSPGVCQSEEYPFCESLRDTDEKIAVIRPFVVYHCGLTNSDGKDAPGRKEREAQMVPGVYYE